MSNPKRPPDSQYDSDMPLAVWYGMPEDYRYSFAQDHPSGETIILSVNRDPDNFTTPFDGVTSIRFEDLMYPKKYMHGKGYKEHWSWEVNRVKVTSPDHQRTKRICDTIQLASSPSVNPDRMGHPNGLWSFYRFVPFHTNTIYCQRNSSCVGCPLAMSCVSEDVFVGVLVEYTLIKFKYRFSVVSPGRAFLDNCEFILSTEHTGLSAGLAVRGLASSNYLGDATHINRSNGPTPDKGHTVTYKNLLKQKSVILVTAPYGRLNGKNRYSDSIVNVLYRTFYNHLKDM